MYFSYQPERRRSARAAVNKAGLGRPPAIRAGRSRTRATEASAAEVEKRAANASGGQFPSDIQKVSEIATADSSRASRFQWYTDGGALVVAEIGGREAAYLRGGKIERRIAILVVEGEWS